MMRFILQMREFGFLLKEMLCPLVIKMFSPSVKFLNVNQTSSGAVVTEKPFFSLTLRLLRVISVLINKMVTQLVRLFILATIHSAYWSVLFLSGNRMRNFLVAFAQVFEFRQTPLAAGIGP